MRVTITDIAKKLNLSNSTVSRALKDDSRISEEVRKVVRDLAQEMGYRPNLLARSLVSDKTESIGLVINDISWSFFGELSQHVQNACERYGYSMFLYSSGDDPKKEMHGIDSMIARRSDGLIVFANECEDNIRELERISKSGYPVVLMNNLSNVTLDIVAVDNLKGTYQVMEYLFGLGHRRIAYVGPKPRKVAEKERLAGYEACMREKYGTVDKSMVYTSKPYALLGYDATREILGSRARPTAIVVFNDNLALGAMRAVLESGMKIPDDISVVGFDRLEIGLSAYPPLTTVSIPLRQMASTAVDIIMHRLEARGQAENEGMFAPQSIKLVPQLIIRGSSGAVAQNPPSVSEGAR
jgi:LacI family transcriptional regulator